jgi:hypothetical protein
VLDTGIKGGDRIRAKGVAPLEVMRSARLRLFTSGIAIAFVLQLGATPIASVEPDLTGNLAASAQGDAIDVTVSYRSSGTITGFAVFLSGPAYDGVLFDLGQPSADAAWSGRQRDLIAGTYTVTVRAAVEVDGQTKAFAFARTVEVAPVPGPGPIYTPPNEQAPAAPANEAKPEPIGGAAAFDVVVYGGTPSGVMAAISAARHRAKVALVEPTGHVGGMMSNGLNATDIGHTATIGGYAREFFDRMEQIEGSSVGRYRFQPSNAELVFEQLLAGAGVRLFLNERLAESGGVTKTGTQIVDLAMESGLHLSAAVFIDASYEGDLMAAAEVSYRVGREAGVEYGEALAGVRSPSTVFTPPPGIDPGFPLAGPGATGSADNRLQNSNYRLCFSTDPLNQVPFSAPSDYNPETYDIVAAYTSWRASLGQTPDITWFLWPVSLTNNKFDVNDNGQVAIAVHGLNTGYPDGTYTERQEIMDWLRDYTQGFLHFLAKDPRVPQRIRSQMSAYGLCKDEFVDNGHWPRLMYLREGRRMLGQYILTERDVMLQRTKADTVAIASYALDSHHVSRWIDGSGRLRVEGGFWTGRANATRWSIPYRSLTPRANEATNLLVSVTVSASHVATASLRMEPHYMMIGEAAGTAAAIASIEAGRGTVTPVQSIDVQLLRDRLREHGSVIDNYLFYDILSTPFRGEIEASYLAGITFGCTPITFCPSSAVTREITAAWLVNALDLPPAVMDHFTDDEDSPYEESINRVADAGITYGCGGGRFCPAGSVTRGEMAAFLKRAFNLPPTTIDYFTDDETSIFEGDINRLAASGITAGCGGTRFCPLQVVTREQMAAFLRRATK